MALGGLITFAIQWFTRAEEVRRRAEDREEIRQLAARVLTDDLRALQQTIDAELAFGVVRTMAAARTR